VCFRSTALVGLMMVLTGCASATTTATPSPARSPSPPPSPSLSTVVGFAVTSSDLKNGRWPASDACDGADNPPDLHWTAGPAGTASYALQVFDPDAPNGGFTHWMLANEPPDLRQPTPGTGVSGRNDFGVEGYNGPCPPQGSTHHYVVTIYAVAIMLPLRRLYSHLQFQQALTGHILAQSSLTATYSR
jgi:Raf kinase inhibitor-like YbhB/YbcL family protein